MTPDEPTDEPSDELRARLRAADPAASLPPADRTGVARLLEDVMNDPHTDESRVDGPRGRSRLTWLVAAAAVALIAGGGAFALASGDERSGVAGEAPGTVVDSEPAPPVEESTSPPADEGEDGQGPREQGQQPEQSVTRLTLAAGGTAGRCLPPRSNPQVVAAQTTVVDGTVESISAGVATLVPNRFYAGEETDLVTVRSPSGDLAMRLGGVELEEGRRYLVAATDGRVTLCGFSDAYSPRLARVYERAFED